MSRFFFLSGILTPLLLFGVTDTAQAYINLETANDRYRYSERRIMQFDEFTTASGSTTFDRRAAYLRASQYKRIQEDLEKQEFGTTPARTRPYYLPTRGTTRVESTIRRRLSEAEQEFSGIRLRSMLRANQRSVHTSVEDRQQQMDAYRQRIRDAAANRAVPVRSSVSACYELSRRRLAQCLYEFRVDVLNN